MRTFEDFKENIRLDQLKKLNNAKTMLNECYLSSNNIHELKDEIDNCKKNLNNIDEVAIIELGYTVNTLIDKIRDAYELHILEYNNDFNKFMRDYVFGVDENGNYKNGLFYGQAECKALGLEISDLSCMKDGNPSYSKSGDVFRCLVNKHMGSNITLRAEYLQSKNEFEGVLNGHYGDAIKIGYVHYMEVLRDSGKLKNGNTYYLLSEDKRYLESKEYLDKRLAKLKNN